MNHKILKKKEMPATNKSTMSEGEKFWKEFQDAPYSSERIGQGFVIHLPSGIRKEGRKKISK